MASLQFNFSGENVLVTGASRGIGEAVARAFAEDEAVDETARRLGHETGTTIAAIRCDITDRAGLAAAMAGFSRIDVLVNNAGLERITPLLEAGGATEEVFRRIVDINLTGTYYVTREAARRMVRGGRIVFTASVWGRVGVAEFSAYSATKHATIGFMRSMAHELGPRDIRVNAVCPGWVKTYASMLTLKTMAGRSRRSEADLLEDISGAQVLAGLMEPADDAALYLFLASPGAANITGQAIVIDRGEVMA
jgi:3-hydroxybutyrate dehydrogenase